MAPDGTRCTDTAARYLAQENGKAQQAATGNSKPPEMQNRKKNKPLETSQRTGESASGRPIEAAGIGTLSLEFFSSVSSILYYRRRWYELERYST